MKRRRIKKSTIETIKAGSLFIGAIIGILALNCLLQFYERPDCVVKEKVGNICYIEDKQGHTWEWENDEINFIPLDKVDLKMSDCGTADICDDEIISVEYAKNRS